MGKTENEIIQKPTNYSEIFTCIINLLNSNLFNITIIENPYYLSISTVDKHLYYFYTEFKKLLDAKEIIGEKYYNEKLKELINKLDKTIKES